jgi:lipoprotein-anchoring transpeptidase ErfK/SrfK
MTAAALGVAAIALAAGAAAAPAARTPAPTHKPKLPVERAIASAPTAKVAWTARVVLPVRLAKRPTKGAQRGKELSPYAPYDGGPQTLLVLGARSTRKDGVWYRLLLPSRPNTASAWVPAESVRVTPTRYRIRVDLSSRVVALKESGEVVKSWTVAVGTSQNPTPLGHFAVSEIVHQVKPSGFFGPEIITLTAHSQNLNEFDGGDGRVALHGTNLPQLLGKAVSHGCVRLPNDAIRLIARTVPPGTPVDVVP